MAEGREREFLLSVFLMEAWDSVAAIEDGIGAGVPAPEALLVVAHRLKGTAALHGFPGIASLAGAMETALERLPSLSAGTRTETLGGLGSTADYLKGLLDEVATGGREDATAIATFLDAHLPAPPAAAPLLEVVPDVLEYFGPEAAEHLEAMTDSLITFERDAGAVDEIHRCFRATHTLKGAAYTVGATPIGDLAHAMEDLLSAVREERASLSSSLVEALFTGIDAIRALLAPDGFSDPRAVVENARERLAAVAATLSPGPVEATPAAHLEAPVASAARSDRPSVRVHLERLDGLMNLVGELVTSRSRLERRLDQLQQVGELLLASRTRMARAVERFEVKHAYSQLPAEVDRTPLALPFNDLEFDRYDDFNILARSLAEISSDIAEVQNQLAGLVRVVGGETGQVQRLTGALRREVTQARLVPIGRLFARFARQVRDLARAEGKTVTLEVSGDTLEVDNRIIEEIADPLLHLVRNAIAHGVESEAERRASGKAPAGTLSLRARQRGAFVEIEVADDGRGIDTAALPARAMARGLITPEAAARLSKRDALDLIFLPGFSTATAVTVVSGRGVGMDVVRTNVSRLGGDIDIETAPGVGTRFILRLPLTVTIADALLVQAGGQTFALPVSVVRCVLEVSPEDIGRAGDLETVNVEGEAVPLVDLAATLGLVDARGEGRVPVVVTRGGRKLLAIAVDRLLDKEEIVIKPFDAFLEGQGPFSGATLSGSGEIVLILDPARVLEASRDMAPTAPTVPPPPAPLVEVAPRILLVDDSVSVRRFVGQMLERAGFQVTLAGDGAEALESLADTAVDLVVTDLEMPRLNGYELIRDLRRRQATRHVPIVVVTTRAGAKHTDLARELGVQHYITKPVDAEHFVPLIDALVHGEAAAR